MIRAIAAYAALLALAGCSGADLARTCEDVEPFRPIIRGAIDIATEGATVVPFMITRNIHCADAESVAERLRGQR